MNKVIALSPEQRERKTYTKNEDLYFYIINRVVSAIEKEKSIAIAGEPESIAQINNLFDDLGILYFNSTQHLSPDTIPSKQPIDSEYYGLGLEMRAWSEYVSLTNEKIFGEWTTIDAIKVIDDARKNVTPYPFVVQNLDFEFTPTEFYDFKKAIKSYIAYNRFYNQDGLKARVLNKYNKKKILSSDIQELNDQVRGYLKSLEELKAQILTGLQILSKANEDAQLISWHEELKKLASLEVEIRNFIQQFGEDVVQSPGLLTFNGKIKERYSKWKDIQEKVNLTIDNPIEMLSHLDQLAHQINHQFSINNAQNKHALKSINDLNTNLPILAEASTLLNDTIKQVNQSLIFNQPIECNTKSFLKKLNIIEQLMYDMKVFLQSNNIQAVIEWSNLEDVLPSSFKAFLEQLKSCPIDEWHDQFEHFYLMELLSYHHYTKKAYLYKSLESTKFYSQISDFRANWIRSTKNLLIHRFEKKIELLKDNNKTLHKKWKKDGLPSNQLMDSLGLTSVMTALINERENWSEFDECIAIGVDVETNSKLTVLDQQDGYQEDRITSHLNIPSTLQDTNLSKQLNLVKGLVYNVFPFLDTIRAFQMKKANIISLIHRHWQDELSDSTISLTAKEFSIQSVEHLIDFFLSTDRPLIIIHQDGMINSTKANILDQLTCLSQLSQAGIKLVNINSYDYLNSENLFESIWQELNLMPTTEDDLASASL